LKTARKKLKSQKLNFITFVLFFSFLFLSFYLVAAQNVIKIENINMYYPSYYVKVNLYNIYQTSVLIDTKNQNRTIYVEILEVKDINALLENIKSDLEDFYEKKYSIFVNQKSSVKNYPVYIFGYTFPNYETEYKNLKYYIGIKPGRFLGVYCMGPSKEFDELYKDFINLVESLEVK
ncbi:MAG: hypothetical protein ACK4ZM_04110, partial [bacterium]